MDNVEYLRYRAENLDRVFYALENGYLKGDLEEIIRLGYLREVANRINTPEHSNEETGDGIRADHNRT